MKNDVKQRFDSAMAELVKAHGDESVTSLGPRVGKVMPHIATGILPLDKDVLGIGGFPKGRIVEVYGGEASSKTTLALNVVAEAQRQGGLVGYCDAEQSLDSSWMVLNGVDVDALIVSQPEYGEQALDIVETMVRSGKFALVVVDSVAALTPKSEIDGDFTDANMGVQARLMGKAMRKLTSVVSKTDTLLLFINQTRTSLGVTYGSPVVTTGGKALKFYASIRLEVTRIGSIKDGEIVVGNKVRFKAVKNKVAPPFRQVEVDLLFSCGFDKLGTIIDGAILEGMIEKKGSWYAMGETKLGQGRDSVKKYLNDNPKVLKDITTQLGAK